MELSKEETEQVIKLIEERMNYLKGELVRLDGYYQQAKKDMATWNKAMTKLETEGLDLALTIRNIRKDQHE